MPRQRIILILVIVVLLIVISAYTLQGATVNYLALKYAGPNTRAQGFNLNNPGNIRKSGDWFNGEVQTSNCCFKAFESMDYGYRAMFVILYNDIKAGKNSVSQLINEWAPPSENNTNSYLEKIEALTGLSPWDKIGQSNLLAGWFMDNKFKKLVRAMSVLEIGHVNESELKQGYRMFLKDKVL